VCIAINHNLEFLAMFGGHYDRPNAFRLREATRLSLSKSLLRRP
jgi:hypothetical protein